MTRFIFTKNYSAALERIEDYIFLSTGTIEGVEKFLVEHDKALKFIEQNPNAPAIHHVTGDQSWIFADGRYRFFFKAVKKDGDLTIYLTHIIDNREANLDVYPSNTIPTYGEE